MGGGCGVVQVGCIVLDEVHYLGDPHRGTVWEECVIYCPSHVQLLCLSATVRLALTLTLTLTLPLTLTLTLTLPLLCCVGCCG